MSKICLIGFTIVLLAKSVWAIPLPSMDYVGTVRAIKVTTSGAGYFPNTVTVARTGGGNANLGGGGFTAQFNNTGTFNALTAVTTTVWCIDSQLQFANNNSFQANVTRLTNPWNASEVRFGDLAGNTGNVYNNTGLNAKKFVYDVGLTAALDTALTRTRMAAYLVSRYNGFPSGPAGSGAANDKNDALQRAVWKIIYNNEQTNPYNYSSAAITAGAPSGSDWIKEAKAFVLNSANEAFYSKWAVVTWDVNASGAFEGAASNTPDKQTFLVQVVPEPGFYGLLGLGLSGLLLAVRRRRNMRER